MKSFILALTVIAGLTSGNFIFQMFLASEPNFFLAAERSFFQAWAIFMFLLADRFKP